MNRRRSRAKAHFPPNLYESKGYFTYRNPVTKEPFGFGSNKARAFSLALQCNAKLATPMQSIVDRVVGGSKTTVQAWETKYQAILDKHDLTPATRSNYRSHSRRVVRMLGDKSLRSITAKNISDGLEGISVDEGLPSVAKAVRAYVRLSFEEAVNQGWIDANPVRITRIVGDTKVKRSRLEMDVLMRIYNAAHVWLQNAIALALVSAQRREDVARAEFKDFHDGGWWLEQASEKTDHPHRIVIPLSIKLHGFGLCLGDVIGQARRSGAVSRYVVHQTRRRGRSAPGGKLRLSTLTRAFTDAVEALGIDWGEKTPPTFHEIRSLSARLYEAQGIDPQTLLGHSDAETTAIYTNNRGIDWVKVTV